MNKIEDYKTPEWYFLRLEVLKRDNYNCRMCQHSHNLHVHHIMYIGSRRRYNYPTWTLITLCNDCHMKWHRENNHYNLNEKHFSKIKKLNVDDKEKIVDYIVFGVDEGGNLLRDKKLPQFIPNAKLINFVSQKKQKRLKNKRIKKLMKEGITDNRKAIRLTPEIKIQRMLAKL